MKKNHDIAIPPFDLQERLRDPFEIAYRAAIRKGKNDVIQAELEKFYLNHWRRNLKPIRAAQIPRDIRQRISLLIPGTGAPEFLICARIVVVRVRNVPVAVFALVQNHGVPQPELFVDTETYRERVGIEIVKSPDMRRIRFGAYAPRGLFAAHIEQTSSYGSFVTR